MSVCDHDLGEMETACADGQCPICMIAIIKRQDADNERLRAALAPFAHEGGRIENGYPGHDGQPMGDPVREFSFAELVEAYRAIQQSTNPKD